jgi:hypothetical protein
MIRSVTNSGHVPRRNAGTMARFSAEGIRLPIIRLRQAPRRSSLEDGDAKELEEMQEEREDSEVGDEMVHEPRGRATGHVEFEVDGHGVANSSPHGMQ